MSETYYTLDDETVEDATRAALLLRKQPEIDPARIFVSATASEATRARGSQRETANSPD